MEVKDREITLDDLYALNLSKLDEWKCLIAVCYHLFCLYFVFSSKNRVKLPIGRADYAKENLVVQINLKRTHCVSYNNSC